VGRSTDVWSTARWAMRQRRVRSVLRSAMKAPLVLRADDVVRSMRSVTVPEFLQEIGSAGVTIPPADGRHHGWQIGALEQALLAEVTRSVPAETCFELGTFDGGTTLALAKAIGPGGVVHTIDLPDEQFDTTQSPTAFISSDVGRAFRETASQGRAEIVQHRGDSMTFDFTPWRGTMDVVLVDGAHDHAHGAADSRTALMLARPGGWVVWDDVEPYWHGLVHGITSVVAAERLTKIARTSLAYLRTP
jgi:predicted O-methyltransferase YrrM